MRVVESRHVDDCLDGQMVRDLFLDGPITAGLIQHLGGLGKLEYFPGFARPFFRLTKHGYYIAKGVEGNDSFNVVFVRDGALQESELRRHVGDFRPEGDEVHGR